MFATFNLQLTPLNTPDAAPEIPLELADALAASPVSGFASHLQLQVDDGGNGIQYAAWPSGEFVPQGGNSLPLPTVNPADSEAQTTVTIALPVAEPDVESADPISELAALPIVPGLVTSPHEAVTLSPGGAALVDAVRQESATTPATRPVAGPSDGVGPSEKPALTQFTAGNVTVDLPKPLAPLPGAEAPAISAMLRPPETASPERVLTRGRPGAPRIDAPGVNRELNTPPRAIVNAEADIAQRLPTAPEVAAVPDRSAALPAQSASIATLSNFATQVTAAAARETTSGQLPDLVRTPVTDPAWGERIGQRVVMMAGNQVQQAEIRLTPAELGPVRVQIAVEDGAANVTFQAQHAITREALEAAMPRLREMLSDNGVSLGQASVTDDGVAEGKGDRRDTANSGRQGEPLAEQDDDRQPERRKTVTADGLVDTFA